MDQQEETRKINNIFDILPFVGEFGPFQWMLDLIFCFVNFVCHFQIMIMYFSTLIPSWKCKENSTVCIWNGTLPGSDQRRCELPRNEWQYTASKEYSIVTTFSIDCQEQWMLQLINSAFFIGAGVGSIVMGYIADNHGRKKLLIPSVTVILIAGFVSSFSPNVYIIMALRFIIGCFSAGTSMQAFILISEFVGNKNRPFAGVIIFITTPIAYMVLSLKAYYIQNWRILAIVCSAPYIFVIAFHKFIPESLEWLLEQGKVEEVEITLRRVADWNKKEYPTNVSFTAVGAEKKKKSTPIDIFRTRKMALITTVQGFIWCTLGFGYYGIMLASEGLGGSIYLNIALLNVGPLIATPVSPYLSSHFGRKPSTLIPMLIGCLVCYCVVIVPQRLTVIKVVLGVIGKFCVEVAYCSVFTWTSELYPVLIRSEGIGFLEVCSKVGSSASPWIANHLKQFGWWIPFVVMGTFMLIACLLGIYLPETKEIEHIKNYEKIPNWNTDESDNTSIAGDISGQSNNGYEGAS